MKKLFFIASLLFATTVSFSQTKLQYQYDSWGVKEFNKDSDKFPEGGTVTFDLSQSTLKIQKGSELPIVLKLFGKRTEQGKYIYYKCLDVDISLIEIDLETNTMTVVSTFYTKDPISYYYNLKLISKS